MEEEIADVGIYAATEALKLFQESLWKAIKTCPRGTGFIEGMEFAAALVDAFLEGMKDAQGD